MKRFYAILLALALCLSLMTTWAVASEETEDTLVDLNYSPRSGESG